MSFEVSESRQGQSTPRLLVVVFIYAYDWIYNRSCYSEILEKCWIIA